MKPHLWLNAGPRPVESGCQAGQRDCRGRGTAPTCRSVGMGEGGSRVVRRGEGGKSELSCHFAYPPPCPPTVVVPLCKILIVCRVNRPEMAFSIVASTRLYEAIVERQVVTHAVPPVFILLEHKEKRNWVRGKVCKQAEVKYVVILIEN